MCRGVLPLLRKGRTPALCNIGSIVARRGLPGRSEYAASKFAVAGFTEAIRAEWWRDGIDVLLMNPGFTATEFEKNLVIHTAVYKTEHRRTMTAEFVAEATLRALERGKKEVTLSGPGRFLLLVNRVRPPVPRLGPGPLDGPPLRQARRPPCGPNRRAMRQDRSKRPLPPPPPRR